ncbi:MAG: hypothetical protein Q9188_004932 [Gyalolechia gomerana]
MADPLSISLRAWPSQDKTKESVSYLISRINGQRGSFRNITEASLEEEVRSAEAGEVDTAEVGENKQPTKDSQDAQSKGNELFQAREEIIKQISAAQRASSNALEFVSLLLSKYTSKAAESTISPSLKAMVPMGSIGAGIMQERPRSEAEKTTEGLLGLGWRMQSLARSADSLLKSASRLEQEMERETAYWQEILAVKESGWSLCRLPGEGHTLGVRFGFGEGHDTHIPTARPEFRDRGLAALRRDTEGNVKLDRGPRWQGDKRLRVRLLRNGKPSATSDKPTTSDDEELPLPQTLIRARNSLFDEELYQEINREARNLIHQGVSCIGDTIRFPFQDHSQIELDLVAVDEQQEIPDPKPSEIPLTIALTLRILLSHAHRENLARRSKPPAPIANNPTPRPVYPLLRPILEFIQHDSATKAIQTLLTHLNASLSAAKLTFSTKTKSSSLTLPNPPSSTNSSKSTITNLLTHLTAPHLTLHTLHLPSTHTTLDLQIDTSVFAPVFGTSFALTTTTLSPSPNMSSGIAQMPPTLTFPTVRKMKDHLYHIIALDVVVFLLERKEIGEHWGRRNPYQAELTRRGRRRDRVLLWVDEGGLGVEWSCEGGSGKGKRVWSVEELLGEKGRVEEGLVDVFQKHVMGD